MKVIVSHTNLDFDGLASLIGAKRLFPQAEMIIPEKLSPEVEHFLGIYKDIFLFRKSKDISWDHVKEAILVDTSQILRTGKLRYDLKSISRYTVFDHHPLTPDSITNADGEISSVGATVTMIIEKIRSQSIPITPFEATVFALGIYSDTGSFTYDQTTSRDLQAAAWCLENGANLTVIEQYRDIPLKKEQQRLIHSLIEQHDVLSIDGLDVVICSYEQSHYTGNLSGITRKLLQITGSEAVFTIVRMGEKIFITTRAISERINVLPVIYSLGGGGHEKAASAMVKEQTIEEILTFIKNNIHTIITPSITAEDIMSSPVRVVAPDTSIKDVSKMLYRYGHTGFPVVEDEKLVGVISRRDVDKALHHGLGHAPVKGYMSRQPVTINQKESLTKIQELMIEKQIGRLPVMSSNQLIGIVSRSDVIQAIHGNSLHKYTITTSIAKLPYKKTMAARMKKHFDPTLFSLLTVIGNEADTLQLNAYLIGGMVRDLLLNRSNEDIDIVIEGDGIVFATHLQKQFGGNVRFHEAFRTATWKHPSGLKIDITSARTEFYDFPAALPKVEMSTIKEDLYRRDFTINAMAICLHKQEFGQLIDFFHGYQDLKKQKLKVLYNLSFVEDPTRILRALRFESRFGFIMDKQTEVLAKESANNLLAVTKSRISSELKRLFIEENAVYAVQRMDKLGLLPFIMKRHDNVERAVKKFSLLSQAVHSLRKENHILSKSIWISYLTLLTPLPFDQPDWGELTTYCISKEDNKLLEELKTLNTTPLQESTFTNLGEWHKSFSSYSVEALLTFFSLLESIEGLKYLNARENVHKEIKVTGKDLIGFGLSPGPHFKELLLKGEIIQLKEPHLSTKDIITKLIK